MNAFESYVNPLPTSSPLFPNTTLPTSNTPYRESTTLLPFVNSWSTVDQTFDISSLTQGENEEQDIFSFSEVRYTPPSTIRCLVTSNNVLIIAIDNGHLIRLNLLDPAELEDIEITRSVPINKIFLDPTGFHLLICLSNEDTYYLAKTYTKPMKLAKMRGVESVAWDREPTQSSIGIQILVGTNSGSIFEGLLKDGLQRYKQMINVEPVAITGLAFEKFPGEEKYFVLACTPEKLYQFVGGPTLEQAFLQPLVTHFPGSLPHSQLKVFSVKGGTLSYFMFLSKPGIYHGSIQFSRQNPGESVLVPNTGLFPYPEAKPVQSVVLTEFYFLLLYPTKVQAISKLTSQTEWETPFKDELIAFSHDPVLGIIFCFSATRVYEIHITDEDKNVWEKYLNLNKFEEALQYAKKPQQKDQVWIKRAEHYFKNEQYDLSAMCYAHSKKSFEEICLKFITKDQYDPLRSFLTSKLGSLNKKDSTQATMISTWLVQIYINKLHEMSRKQQDTRKLEGDFHTFLEDYHEKLDFRTTFNLLSAHASN
eukprot:TRINITY_DN17500_c0_g1_i2.p1 TRINITY_DN17500_c0_g1~~TRINITY_DN17500_c0_g1_i2.p1  ORF type:complete len:535 (+),score=91.80 TRINITY_DN17500_c0_g1_i2:819-2423(+)